MWRAPAENFGEGSRFDLHSRIEKIEPIEAGGTNCLPNGGQKSGALRGENAHSDRRRFGGNDAVPLRAENKDLRRLGQLRGNGQDFAQTALHYVDGRLARKNDDANAGFPRTGTKGTAQSKALSPGFQKVGKPKRAVQPS